MESFGLYLLKSAVWLTGFALVFLVILRNERYFRLNRIYLLAGIVASILFPLYTWHYTVILPFVPDTYIITSGIPAVVMAPSPTVIPFYFWFYVVGIAGLAIRLTWQTGRVVRKLRKTGYVKTGSVKLVRTSEYDGSFSFFSFVFVNPSITELETKEIVNHEREHIHQKHWFDLLLVELLCILQWFNPFVWIYARLIRQNHEYLADQMALQYTSNPAIYQATLLNQMLGAPVISLANSFSYSLNKKRFKMMKKKIDSPYRILRMLLVLPLVVMVFYAFAKPEYITSEPATSASSITTITEAMNELGVPVNGPANKPEPVMQVEKDKIVKGKIVNPDGKPLAGAAVIIKGTSKGTVTDRDGNFQFKDVPEDRKLVISFVGYATAEVKPDFEKPMAITMAKQNVGIDGVVVIGYSDVTPPPPPSDNKGTISFRNTKNPPLVLVDGVIVTGSKLDEIKPDDIKQIDVLKDKTAIDRYGDAGKNGVILITSKKKDVTVIGYGKTGDLKTPASPLGFNIRTKDSKNPPLFIIAGSILPESVFKALDPETIQSVNVLKGESATAKYGDQAKNGAVEVTLKAGARGWIYGDSVPGQGLSIKSKTFNLGPDSKNNPLIMLDGVIIDKGRMETIGPDNIESITVLKDKSAIAIYGEKAKDGVILIVSKKKTGAATNKNVDNSGVVGISDSQKMGKEVFVVVEEMPEFPGGVNELRKYIASQIKYPVGAQKLSVQGKVFVTFVVNSNGKVENAKIVRGVDPALDAEAIRVVNSLPDWKPGQQHGTAVDVAYTMPIEFKLQ